MNASKPEFSEQLASSASNVSVNTFFKTYLAGDLILRPPFQRNLVWNQQQQSFLVDSILRGLPVPEIYIQKETSAEGDEKTIVVDGQQRLTTCIHFLSDELRLVGDDVLDARWRDHIFSELDDNLKRRFRSFDLIVRRLPNVEEPVLREVFRRLNKTVEPLEPQELRHAVYTGPFVRLVENVAAHSVFGEIGIFSAKDYLRRRHDEFFAEAGYAVISKAYPNKKEGLDELFLTYEKQGQSSAVVEDLERRFGRVIEQLERDASSLRRTRFRNKSDFYTLFTFLAKEAERLPLSPVAQEVFFNTLKDFSGRVNELKREEAEGRPVGSLSTDLLGKEALPYLRAVERAASDRLNRVRREEALRAVLRPALEAAKVRPLTYEDAVWRQDTGAEEEPEDTEIAEEREHAQQVLLEGTLE